MKRLILIVALFTVSNLYVSAQGSQEFSVYVGGGFSPLSYTLSLDKFSQGERSGGLGGDFGVGYTYFIADTWGIHSGVGIGFYNAKTEVGVGETVSKNLIDDEGDSFELRSTISGYNETQNTMFLTIPVMAHFILMDKFYTKAGIKAAIPLNCKYSSNDLKITNEGYYPQFNNTINDAKYAGFGQFDIKDSKGNLELGFTVMLALEAGMRFNISETLSLYTGLYFDYGLNNSLKKSSTDTFVSYNINDPENFSTNSVLTEYTDKANIMAVGVKVRVAMGR